MTTNQRKENGVLSNDEIDEIVNDFRTKPPPDVIRHIMPLVQHITEVGDRTCDRCAYWVGWSNAHPHDGECVLPANSRRVRLTCCDPVEAESLSLVTAFDWSCMGWKEKITGDNENQSMTPG